MLKDSAAPIVWLGRNQPFHLGHFRIAIASLELYPHDHIFGIVCQTFSPESKPGIGKFGRTYECFTPWERLEMVRLALHSSVYADRTRVQYVPRNSADGRIARSYLPPEHVRGITNKDAEDVSKATRWRSQGYGLAQVDVSHLELVSSTSLRTDVLEGRDWHDSIHESIHAYFCDIDGPNRLLLFAQQVQAEGG